MKTYIQKISPFLWFDNQAEEAAEYYVSIFKNSKILKVSRYGDAGSMPKGSVMIVSFQIEGQEFLALNAGPQFTFTDAISFMVNCDTQEEVDYYWNKLTENGGCENQCGWLKDKFGLSWQITPTILVQYVTDEDSVKADRVMKAMMTMKKIEIKPLEEAYCNIDSLVVAKESNLEKFIIAQATDYPIALDEIKSGRKRNHWMWYIFPQINGLGFSETSKFYALQSLTEANEYLKHPTLGSRLIEVCNALLMLESNDATAIFGKPDDLKLKSSMTLFSCLQNTNEVFQAVLDKFFNAVKDDKTLQIISS